MAAVCFVAVAAYTLFDSDRAARAKVGRIAEIVARDIARQQVQWFSMPVNPTPDLQRVAALMEPGLCISYRDNAGTFPPGRLQRRAER